MSEHLENIISFIKNIRTALVSEKRATLSQEGKDISLSTDKFLHHEITSYLTSSFDYPILSEESENRQNYLGYRDFFWIIDPLDGTLNYSKGIPLTCISIALWNGENPVFGLIYDFNNDDLYTGAPEKSFISDRLGMWLNNVPAAVSGVPEKDKGVICTGFPSWRDYGDESLLDFVRKVQQWKKVRLIGSAALSLAWVAAGRAEAYIEEDIRIWDVAAGMALVRAAGGSVYIKPNKRENFVTAIATNGIIAIEELL